MPTHILKKVRQQAVVSVTGTGSTTIDLLDLKLADETFDRPNCNVTIAHVWFHFQTAGNIQRGDGTTVLTVGAGAMDNWDFAQNGGFVLNQAANSNVQVHLGASAGTVIMSLHKSSGYNPPDNQSLPQYLKT